MQKFRYFDSLKPFILKKAEKRSEEFLDEKGNYSNASKLLESIQKDPNITVVKTHPQYDDEINIYDFCILEETFKSEDNKYNLYEEYNIYREFIKKGNTIIEVHGNEEEEKQKSLVNVVHVRKGSYQYLKIYKGMSKLFQLESAYLRNNIEKKDMHIRNLIFNQISASFQRQQKIEVFVCNKIEGCTFHISYLEQSRLMTWIISYNCLNLMHFLDLNTFQQFLRKQNHQYILNILSTLVIMKSFKLPAYDKTIFKPQQSRDQNHLKNNQLTTLQLADSINQSKFFPPGFKQQCLSPIESYEFFKDFHLNSQKPIFIGTFNRFDSLSAELSAVQKKASQIQYEEGVCEQLIFCIEPKSEQIIMACKVKVIEQQILKKLRKQFEYIQDNQGKSNKEIIEQELKQFLKKFTSSALPRQKFLYKVLNTTVINQAFKLANINELKTTNFTKVIQEVLNSFQSIQIDNDTQIILPKNPLPCSSKQFKIIIPISIPGSGKSYLHQQMQKKIQMMELNDIACESLELDAIRAELLKKAKSDNNNINKKEDQLFHEISKAASEVYWKKLKLKLEEALCNNSNLSILYLDKNHTPSNLEATLCFLHSFFKKHSVTKYELIQLVPLIPDKKNQFYNYPFSINYIMHCLFRVQSRIDHKILNENGVNSVNIVLGFLKSFETVDFTKFILHKKESIIEMPFVDEKTVIESKKIQYLLDKALWSVGKLKSNNDFYKEMISFVKYFQSYKFQFSEPEENLYNSKITSLLSLTKEIQTIDTTINTTNQKQQAKIKKQDVVVYIEKKQQIQTNNTIIQEEKSNENQLQEEKSNENQLQEEKIYTQLEQQTKEKNAIDYQQIKQIQINQFLKLNDHAPYKPSTLPKTLSLTIFEDIKQQLLEYTIQNLNYLNHKYQDAAIQDDINLLTKIDSQSQWSLCKQFNIEAMDLRDGKTKMEELNNKPEFFTFVPEKEVHIRIYGMLYIPKKFILCFPFIDASELLFHSLFPYLALFHTNGFPENQAKQVLQLLFTETSLQYDEQFFQKKQNLVKMFHQKSFTKAIKAKFYVVNSAKPIACVGITKELF